MSTSTVAITLDLGCCRCKTKIHKILCCLQERCGFVFEKEVYEMDKVIVSGPFDAIDLCCKLRCKAGCFVTKIEIVPPPEPEPPEPDPKKKNKKKKKKKQAESQPVEPEPVKCKALITYPCPYPYPYPCQCYSCRPPPPPTPPPTPPPPCPPPAPPCPKPPRPCPPPVCNKCPTWMPCQCRGYPWPWVVCCEENMPSDGACAVM